MNDEQRAQALKVAARHLPTFEDLQRLDASMRATIEMLAGETKVPDTILSGHQVDAIVEQICTALKSPSGFDILCLLMPELLDISKEGAKLQDTK